MLTIRLVIAAVLLAGLAGCATLEIDRRQALSPVWTTEGETSLRDHAVPHRISPPLEERWDFNAGAGFGRVSPLIVGDVALVANRKGEVHAIDMDSGRRVGQESFGESIDGTPVYKDGILVVPLSWGGVALHAHDMLNGTRKWRVKGPPVSSGLVVYGGRVIAGDVEGHVRAYRLDDGEEVWTTQIQERSSILSTPVLVDHVLVIADDSGRLAALDARDGSPIWTVEVGAPVQVSLGANETTVFAATTRGRLAAFDLKSGEPLWTYTIANGEVYFAPPAVGEWEVVFGGSDGLVRSLDAGSGAVAWVAELGAAIIAPPVITDDVVYVGTMRSRLVALSRADGAEVWDTELSGRIKSAFAVKGSTLIVMAEPRLVYMFEPSPEPYAASKN